MRNTEDRELSPREATAVAALVEGKTQQQALLEAGYADSVARTQSKAVLDKPRIKNAISHALAEKGLTPDALAGTLAEGLLSHKPVVIDGEITEYPDFSTRHKYLDTALTLAGHYPDKEVVHREETYEERILRLRGIETG